MTIKEYFGDWLTVIPSEDISSMNSWLKETYSKEKCCPDNISKVWRAFRYCSYEKCSAVILGQDVYPDPKYATGIAFGIPKGIKPMPPSLEVLKEAAVDFEIPHKNIIFDETLESWESQGILMLNTALTCKQGIPNSHSLDWKNFIKNFLKRLSSLRSEIIFVLMGNNAISMKQYLDGRCEVITCKHPAYYARNNQKLPSEVFRRINAIHFQRYGYFINFYLEF